MKRLVRLAILLVLVVAAVGWWRDWFKIERSEQGGNTRITLTLDEDRIREDSGEAAAAAKAVTARVSDEVRDLVRRGRFDGVVTGLAGATLLVETSDGEAVRVPLAAETDIELDGRRVEATRLKPGDAVTIDLPEGAAHARSVAATRDSRDPSDH